MFVAQCEAKPGKRPRTHRPLAPIAGGSAVPWSDPVAVEARHSAGTKTYMTATDNKIRQLRSAVKALADPDVQLASLPNESARVGRFDGCRLLSEAASLRGATEVPYTVPLASEACFSLPASFFLNGWHICLTDSELALLFCLFAARGRRTPWGDEVVAIDGETRVYTYGLGPDAYAAHTQLQAFGLVEVIADAKTGRSRASATTTRRNCIASG